MPFWGAVSQEGWWAEARLHGSEGTWWPQSHHHSRLSVLCQRHTAAQRGCWSNTGLCTYPLHSFLLAAVSQAKESILCPSCSQQTLIKADRSMLQISCSSIFVLVNFYRLRVYVTVYRDLQERGLCRSSYSKAWLFLPDLIQTVLSSFL